MSAYTRSWLAYYRPSDERKTLEVVSQRNLMNLIVVEWHPTCIVKCNYIKLLVG